MPINKKIIDRIVDKTENSTVLEALADKISLSDLQSLLLNVYQKRTDKIDIKHLFQQYKSNRFTKPSTIDPHKYLDFEQLAFSLLPTDYRTLEISPEDIKEFADLVSVINAHKHPFKQGISAQKGIEY